MFLGYILSIEFQQTGNFDLKFSFCSSILFMSQTEFKILFSQLNSFHVIEHKKGILNPKFPSRKIFVHDNTDLDLSIDNTLYESLDILSCEALLWKDLVEFYVLFPLHHVGDSCKKWVKTRVQKQQPMYSIDKRLLLAQIYKQNGSASHLSSQSVSQS